MKYITIGVINRIVMVLIFLGFTYSNFKLIEWNQLLDNGEILFDEYESLRKNSQTYNLLILFLFILYSFLNLRNKKQRIDRDISLREYILPEFNHSDERESVLTGKAAKAGLAITFVYSILVLSSFIFPSNENRLYFMLFGTASIPIVGLISYYISYRYYYSK